MLMVAGEQSVAHTCCPAQRLHPVPQSNVLQSVLALRHHAAAGSIATCPAIRVFLQPFGALGTPFHCCRTIDGEGTTSLLLTSSDQDKKRSVAQTVRLGKRTNLTTAVQVLSKLCSAQQLAHQQRAACEAGHQATTHSCSTMSSYGLLSVVGRQLGIACRCFADLSSLPPALLGCIFLVIVSWSRVKHCC
jgi:hypothetical protein